MLLRAIVSSAGRPRGLVRPLASLRHRPVSSQPNQSPHDSDATPPLGSKADADNNSDSSVLVERRPIPGHNAGYLVVTLNRPKQTNALDVQMLHELQGVFDTLPGDKSVRCVILTGAGHAFCGGHDLYQMDSARGNKAVFERMFARCSRCVRAWVWMDGCIPPSRGAFPKNSLHRY